MIILLACHMMVGQGQKLNPLDADNHQIPNNYFTFLRNWKF